MSLWPEPGGTLDLLLQRKLSIIKLADKLQGKEVTVDHLEFLAIVYLWFGMQEYRLPDAGYLESILSETVPMFFLGKEWAVENTFVENILTENSSKISKQHRDGRAFLETESADRDSRFRHTMRINSLAECLFNLQHIPGIRKRINLMKSGGLEAALGELECIRLLSEPKLKLRFNTPVRKKGLDYDAEITSLRGQTIACEIKTKESGRGYDISTIRNTLEEARKQLPKGIPGVILVRIPEDWVLRDGSGPIVESAVAKLLRQSNRVVAVTLAWEESHKFPAEGGIVLYRSKNILNTSSSMFTPDVQETVAEFGVKQPWLTFRDLLASRLDAMVTLMSTRLFIKTAAAPLPYQQVTLGRGFQSRMDQPNLQSFYGEDAPVEDS